MDQRLIRNLSLSRFVSDVETNLASVDLEIHPTMTTPIPHDSRSKSDLIRSHRPDIVAARLQGVNEHSYLKDFIYGAIDGAVTTFAVVSGVAGAQLSGSIVLILGVANLIGDGFSMAAGNYLGTRAEAEHRERVRNMEERHIANVPDGEREEIRQIFREKGFEGELLEQVVDTITADHQRWVDTMLHEEHGLPSVVPSAIRAATVTFIAFLLVGAIPLIPFVMGLLFGITIPAPYVISTVLTAIAFFGVGAAKSRVVDTNWMSAGMETLFVGSMAAGLAYLCGVLLGKIV